MTEKENSTKNEAGKTPFCYNAVIDKYGWRLKGQWRWKMGTYNLSPAEIINSFREWMQEQDGEVHAWCIAEAWNQLAKENGWSDTLNAVEG